MGKYADMKKANRKYRRLTWDDRIRIETLYNTGHTLHFIAKTIGFAVSSIHAEIKKGLWEPMGRELHKTRRFLYSAQIAQDHADVQATIKGSPIKLGHNHAYARHIASQITKGISPDIIVNTLKQKGEWTVSTPTLYRYIDQGYIPNVTNKNLTEKPKRKRSYKKVRKHSTAPKGLSIEKRPKEINRRTTFGHWEMDSIIGKSKGNKQSLIVLTERKTRFEIVIRTSAKTSAATVAALDHIIPQFPKGTFKTITVDNGSEFQDCHGMEHDPNGNKRLTVYYCHPYTSSERGSNERNNRILRRHFPKGKSLNKVTQQQCDSAADALNTMPRKILGYRTAAECFAEELSAL